MIRVLLLLALLVASRVTAQQPTNDTRTVPYGKSQPVLTCAPLRTCLIRLQAGESVLGPPALGDSERWITGLMVTAAGGATPVVYVKPVACDITTNLVISTDRHLYNIGLDSPACPTNPATNNRSVMYTGQLNFSCPDESGPEWKPKTAPAFQSVSPERFNFDYEIKKDRHFPWKPLQIFDDGVHAYIKLPPGAENTAAPVLFILNEDKSRTILNYTLTHNYYVTDRVFEQAVLVVAESGKERKLTLVNTAHSAKDAQ